MIQPRMSTGAVSVSAVAINDWGDIVGSGQTASGDWPAHLWQIDAGRCDVNPNSEPQPGDTPRCALDGGGSRA